MADKKFNALVYETSPYLLQHASNPVNWYAWSEEVLQKAAAENRLLIISIGYSTCHWCHVMERECFENTDVADLMNRFFISIKVDREERPDIDQVYMHAVQLMTGRGGWPLNCIALPDGRPIYGGTYFPKNNWMYVLQQMQDLWLRDPGRCRMYADELARGVSRMTFSENHDYPSHIISHERLSEAIEKWSLKFDQENGGMNHAPKFPMPVTLDFLMHYAHCTGNPKILNHVFLTLDKMAFGGIYDHLAGGFARYSTDKQWKIPHFEKMLYDNAQLITTYSNAFKISSKEIYRETVMNTVEWVLNDLKSPLGGFYSARDADSDGKEGKFYVWKKEELQALAGEYAGLIFEYYNINEDGLWEDGNYILMRSEGDETFAGRHGLEINEWKIILTSLKHKMLEYRDKRMHPSRDDKLICSWNALMITALCNAASIEGDKRILNAAIDAFDCIEKYMYENEKLLHSTHEKRVDNPGHRPACFAFLDDYAFLIEACLNLYRTVWDERFIAKALQLCKTAIRDFYDNDQQLFRFTSGNAEKLFAPVFEGEDNVIPSSNSTMAINLFNLGKILDRNDFVEMAGHMQLRFSDSVLMYPQAYARWGSLALLHIFPFHETVIGGNDFQNIAREFSRMYLPETLLAASDSESKLVPLFRNRTGNETKIYVCSNNNCQLPVTKISEALELFRK